jgi:TIR domain
VVPATQPIQFYSCFISYSTKDEEFAKCLHSRVVEEKLRVWYAPEDMKGGRKSVDQIDQAIRVHDKLLLVLSKASMGSDWVMHEIARAVEREKRENRPVLFPIGLSPREDIKAWSAFDSDMGKDVAKIVREYHIPDFSKWKDHDSFEAAFARLLNDLKAEQSTGAKTR